MYVNTEIVSIFLGVISGVFTTALLWVGGTLIKKVVLPWYEQFVYQGVNVSGSWIHTYKHTSQPTHTSSQEDFTFTIILDIQQTSQNVIGVFSATTQEGEREYINYYTVKGLVKDNYLLFDYFAQRRDRTGIGSFLLRVSNGGTQLIGNAVFTPDGSEEDHKVVTRNMVFKRH